MCSVAVEHYQIEIERPFVAVAVVEFVVGSLVVEHSLSAVLALVGRP